MNKRHLLFPLLLFLWLGSFYTYTLYIHNQYMNHQYALVAKVGVNSYIEQSTQADIERGKALVDNNNLTDLLSSYISTPVIPYLVFGSGCIVYLYLAIHSSQEKNYQKYLLNIEKIINHTYTPISSEDSVILKYNDLYQHIVSIEEQNKKDRSYIQNFIEDVAHQIKTPLTSLKVFTELSTDFHQKESIKQINKLENILTQLISLAKMEAHILPYKFEMNNIADTVDSCIEDMTLLLEEKAISIHSDLEECYFYYDDLWISESINNILKNGIEYSSTSSTIEIIGKNVINHYILTIQDYGKTINKEEQLHLFDRFYTTKNDNRKSQGMGIGLNIAYDVIKDHKGLISVQSNQSTTFTIDFPLYSLKEKI